MTDKTAAIQATFSDFKLIRGRKCAQIICEIPIEYADQALEALGGLPRPDRESWLALARLNVTSIKPQQERRPFETLKLAMQASLRCQDHVFWQFLTDEHLGYAITTEKKAADFVRSFCGITSRAQLNDNEEAAAKWQELDKQYQVWRRVPV